MADITIPRGALEAAMREYNRARDNDSENPLYNACLAMLRNWPFRKDEWRDDITFDGKPVRYSVITLPLPQEKQNAK